MRQSSAIHIFSRHGRLMLRKQLWCSLEHMHLGDRKTVALAVKQDGEARRVVVSELGTFACQYVYACMSVFLSACLPACLPARLPACLSVGLFVCLSVCLPVCLSVCLFVCLSACLSACLSVCLCVCLSVCLYGRMDIWT